MSETTEPGTAKWIAVTGPYLYKDDLHPCFRITGRYGLIACVYAYNLDEDAAERRANIMAKALQESGDV